ncbi:Alcohol dehydrogenase transcription factor Myb/SANT-like [Popillia japonica]|uniref:Alcohol dehydrogenase transcription factor Myb/SANT-like n=1 Tax=Popillia japonica TaxID=7064 RepID=A0AAW1LRP9_POPJA
MSDAETVTLLELYQNKPVLWDPTRDDYNEKRDSRAVAARKIAAVMTIEGFTDIHVIMNFKNLRSSYTQEIKKIAESKKSGCSSNEVYVPKVAWFKIMDSFLKPHVKARKSQSNLIMKYINRQYLKRPKTKMNLNNKQIAVLKNKLK